MRRAIWCNTVLFGSTGVERQGRFLLAACFEPYSKHKSCLNTHKALNKTLPSLKTISQKLGGGSKIKRKGPVLWGLLSYVFNSF